MRNRTVEYNAATFFLFIFLIKKQNPKFNNKQKMNQVKIQLEKQI